MKVKKTEKPQNWLQPKLGLQNIIAKIIPVALYINQKCKNKRNNYEKQLIIQQRDTSREIPATR